MAKKKKEPVKSRKQDKEVEPVRRAPQVISREGASKKIVEIGADIYHDIVKRKKKPDMRFPIRALSNVKYDPKRGHFEIRGKMSTRTLTYNTVKTFAQSMRLMATTKKDLLDKNDIAGKREIYYNSKSWGECRFDEQPESDTLLDDMEAMLAVNREQLGYIPEERGGDVAGPLIVIDKNPVSKEKVKVDCAKLGSGAWSIPSRVEHLVFESKAKLILVIETASLFQRLVHHRYYEKADCVLISMSGVPTRACRRFIRRLADDQKLPVLVFTDGDPYGYCNIYRTLKVGSGQAAHINRFFCVPQAHYLGVTPQDIIDYDLEDATHPLEDADIKRAKDALKNDPFVLHHKEWQDALNQMLKMGVRIEQQAFAKHGLNYVLEKYIPDKLKKKKFLP
ncbi:MAG: DNA topoisomerase IV subunit A [Kiritimatiellae bacterium]|nr:DNA topoisomerase IV subunit A [Kiritimatiellia bacterium]MDD5520370.1 DNA topoisomerase IV subunit A [Kiritimatiellia bacterium]